MARFFVVWNHSYQSTWGAATLKKLRAIPEFAYMPVFAVIAKTIYD
jgi:hypothetical protein